MFAAYTVPKAPREKKLHQFYLHYLLLSYGFKQLFKNGLLSGVTSPWSIGSHLRIINTKMPTVWQSRKFWTLQSDRTRTKWSIWPCHIANLSFLICKVETIMGKSQPPWGFEDSQHRAWHIAAYRKLLLLWCPVRPGWRAFAFYKWGNSSSERSRALPEFLSQEGSQGLKVRRWVLLPGWPLAQH